MMNAAVFMSLVLLLIPTGCLKKNSETLAEATFESITGGKNAGFRILPQTAARDALRPRVIYRCNEVRCGEAFQPSNEERDMFIPCDALSAVAADVSAKPYLRASQEGGRTVVFEKEAHKLACANPLPFEKIVAEPMPSAPAVVQGAPACRVFKRDKVACESNASLGCQWVSHPSRHGDAAGGECVAVRLGGGAPQADPNLSGNMKDLSGANKPAVWSDLNTYRSGAVAPSHQPK